MKLCGVAMVASESDVIEAFVRHTLTYVDRLHIHFHNSYDTSQNIVQRLIGEGLPVTFDVAPSPVLRREKMGCALVKAIAADTDYDFILPLDADEFIVAKDRAALEGALASTPEDGALGLSWLSYVPDESDDPTVQNPIQRLRHRRAAPHPFIQKVFARASTFLRDDVILADGNHLLLSSDGLAIPQTVSSTVFLGHFPVRSAQQLSSKVVVGALARQLSPEFTQEQSTHWRALAKTVANTGPVSHADLCRIAREYLDEQSSPIILDPIATRATSLAYGDLIHVDAYERTVRCLVALGDAGAFQPLHADAPAAGGKTVTILEADYAAMLRERDRVRRAVQHAHPGNEALDGIHNAGLNGRPAGVPVPHHVDLQLPARGKSGIAPPFERPSGSLQAAADAMDGIRIELLPVRTEAAPGAAGETTCTVAAKITGIGPDAIKLWYTIGGGHEPCPLAIAHAFTVSVINMAMAVGKDIHLNGPLTRGLLLNLELYQDVWSHWRPELFKPVKIHPSALEEDEPFRAERGFLVPFSGGLDSLHSAWTLHQRGELAALVPIRGLDIKLDSQEMWDGTLPRLQACAASLGVPCHPVATNWEQVAPRLPGYLGYFLPVVAASALFGPVYGAIASPSSYPYDQLVLPLETNPLTDPMLGRPGFPLLHHGAFAHRIEKAAAVADWPEALLHIRPCDRVEPDGSACRTCRKCTHTALSFAGLGLPVPPALGGQPPAITAIEQLELTDYSRMTLREAMLSARHLGISAPWVAVVERRLGEDLPAAPAAAVVDTARHNSPRADAEIARLRQQLDYVLGGRHRPAPARLLQRILRAVRGIDGPRI